MEIEKKNSHNKSIKKNLTYTFLLKIIIFLLFIFLVEKKSQPAKFNVNLNILSILNSNISNIKSPTNLLNTQNISNINTQINNYITTNLNMRLDHEFNEYKEYFQNAKEGKILYEENLVYSQNPLISVVIPLYNNEKYINATIKSVQNQKMKDIEIILVDDCSTDNSTKYVEEAQKKDPRIILIKNNKKMFILYSRGIGALKARGKYIFPLDSDDMIIIGDLFDYIYDEIEKGQYDIVEFSWIYSNNFELHEKSFYRKPYCSHSFDKVIYQPELRHRFNRNRNGILHLPDRFIWGRIISTELYKKAVESFGEDLKLRMTGHDDTMIQFMLFKYGKSFKKIRKIGICHFSNPTSSSSTYFSKDMIETTCLSYINFIDILYKHTENTTMAKEEAYSEFDHWLIQSETKYYKYGLEKKINITKKFYNDPMISKNKKYRLKQFLDFLNNFKTNDNLTYVINDN